MALTRTTLTAPITSNQLTFGVASTVTGFPPVGSYVTQPVVIDDESLFLVTTLVTGAPGTILVRGRGSDGTAAMPHDVGSPVLTSASPGDFPAVAPGFSTMRPVQLPDIVTYGQDGAIAVPI